MNTQLRSILGRGSRLIICLNVIEYLIIHQQNTITRNVLFHIMLQEYGNCAWYPKKQEGEREEQNTKFFYQFLLLFIFFSRTSIYIEIHILSNEFLKNCNCLTMSRTISKNYVSMTFGVHSIVFHMILIHVVSDLQQFHFRILTQIIIDSDSTFLSVFFFFILKIYKITNYILGCMFESIFIYFYYFTEDSEAYLIVEVLF